MALYLGLDIGGTKLLVGAADAQGNILRRVRAETPLDLDEGLALLIAMAREAAAGEPVTAFGAAAGGPLNWESGVISPLHQPEWRDVPLRRIFEKEFGCPLSVDVDTNAGALAEYRFGGVQGRRLLYLTLSTGMGGGYLLDGRIYRGYHGAHPEVAHQAIPGRSLYPDRVVCECGASDCLEAYVSGNGIRRIYGKPAEQLDPEEWREVGENLGQGLRNIVTILLPDVIVLGGSVAIGGGSALLGPALAVLERELKIVPIPPVVLSRLGAESSLYGAIALAMMGNQE
ncbi:glucokinase [Capsulimonas corticalis]|uniref:Glucokinase n=1 Tax=Capsulimonas corticalis TaxID=2219043 RepID=A0A402D1F9_9BACT|nr:ROK family protein [Capsulimonas corticalis]BDI28611.1 glucokinase [Capsulimonas corticalis]